MRWIVRAVAIALCFAVVPAVAAQERKRAITGFGSYSLGAPMQDVLATNPAFEKATSNCCVVTSLPFTTYVAPLDGGPRVLVALAWEGKLGGIAIFWPNTMFQNLIVFASTAQAVRDEILAVCDRSLFRENLLDPDAVAASFGALLLRRRSTAVDISTDLGIIGFELQDTSGSVLRVHHNVKSLLLMVVYIWGPFADAINKAPKPSSPY